MSSAVESKENNNPLENLSWKRIRMLFQATGANQGVSEQSLKVIIAFSNEKTNAENIKDYFSCIINKRHSISTSSWWYQGKDNDTIQCRSVV